MGQPTMLRILLSAIGYSLCPAIIYVLIRLVCVKDLRGWEGVMLRLPAILAVIFAFSAFFTDIVYSYDAANQFHRGPLGYALHVLLTIYVIMLIVLVFQRKVLEERVEQGVMILSAVYVILTMIAEAALSLYGIGRTAIVLTTIFFLSALQTTKLEETIHALQENKELKIALNRLKTAQNELLHSRSIMQALGEDYLSVLYAVPERNEVHIEKLEEHFRYFLQSCPADSEMTPDALTEVYTKAFVVPKEQAEFLATFRREALIETMSEKKSMVVRFNCREADGEAFCVEYHVIRAGDSLSDGIILGIHGVKLLVAEDNALNMEIATTLLSEAGAVITPVSNGETAVEAFSQNPPGTFDVILMDIMMPVMDGLTAARTIRGMQRADAASIPIIAMTANAFDEDMQASKEAGMDAHLAKPLNIAKVISEISHLVYHARREAPPPSRCEVDQ